MTRRNIIATQSFGPTVVKSRRRGRNIIERFNTVFSYIAVMAIVTSMVTIGYQSPIEDKSKRMANASPALLKVDNPSVDQVVAADMAAQTAEVADLSIAANASNLSVSLAAKNELSQSSDTVLIKPQIIQGDDLQRGITEYRVVSGDTVQSVAKKFGISAQTLKWANDLTSDTLNTGTRLLIPSTDGVIYRVTEGDTLEKIARKYKSTSDRIVTYNDLEVGGLTPGQRIVIPDGVLPANERPRATVPTRVATTSPAPTTSGPSTTTGYGYGDVSAGNAYAYGNCTWYSYERRLELGRPIGSFWGNAATWASFARGSGYTVNNTPAPGAIMQDSWSAGGYGHVGIVESMNPDGSFLLSEMNYSGWNVVSTRTISAGEARNYNFIH